MKQKPSVARTQLNWHLTFPGFDARHWWVNHEHSGKNVAPIPDLRAATAWEVLRRSPVTRRLLQCVDEDAIYSGIEMDLREYGTSCWDSLSLKRRTTVSRDLESLPTSSKGASRRFRSLAIRDLHSEALLKAIEIETTAPGQSGRCFPKPRDKRAAFPLSLEQDTRFRADVLDLQSKLINRAESDGYTVMVIAVDSRSASRQESKREFSKMLTLRFADIRADRTRVDPLEIIKKFETGDLKRENRGKNVLNLYPYQNLIVGYERQYGFSR